VRLLSREFEAARDGASKVFRMFSALRQEVGMESVYNVAGIDVHKKMPAVVIANAHDRELQFECRKFGTTVSELRRLVDLLQVQSVQEAAMESTAQYWEPAWIALEGHCRLHLAQAKSNRGPRGRKTNFRYAMQIVNR